MNAWCVYDVENGRIAISTDSVQLVMKRKVHAEDMVYFARRNKRNSHNLEVRRCTITVEPKP